MMTPHCRRGTRAGRVHLIYLTPITFIMCDVSALYTLAFISLSVNCGLDVNKVTTSRWTLLDRAVIRRRKDIILFLIRSGANVDPDDSYPIRCAVSQGDAETLKALLKAGARKGLRECYEQFAVYPAKPGLLKLIEKYTR